MTALGPRIMVVEDDPDDLLFLRRAFYRAGLSLPLVVVADGDEAVRYLDGLPPFGDRAVSPLPGYVLLDLKLPRRSGLEVLRWMRASAQHRDRPVIVFTSSDLPADRAAAEALGIDAYLVKPVGLAELDAAVRQIVALWGIERHLFPPDEPAVRRE